MPGTAGTGMAKSATVWKNRITGHADVDPAQLVPSPLNFRRHPKTQQDALSGLIREIGYLDPVIVQSGTDRVLDGHLRVEQAIREGQPTIPVQYVDLTDAEADLALASIDPVSAMAYHDAENLRQLLDSVITSDAAVQAMLDELAQEAGIETVAEGLTDPDSVPAVPDEPTTKPGDLWLLGRHRLLCGDATVVTDVDRLMDGEKADMVFTDPPYNTGIQQGRTASGWGMIANDDMSSDAFAAWLDDVAMIASVTANGDWYVCCDYRSYVPTVASFSKAKGLIRSCIVWAKDNFGLGIGYRRQHEFIAYWGKFDGNTESDLWSVAKVRGDDYEHPTQKPTALAERAIGNSSKPNDLVLDLFGGSGSTLIACEQTGRRCAMMELDPHYCDVIVRRWEQFTGQTATLATAALHRSAAD